MKKQVVVRGTYLRTPLGLGIEPQIEAIKSGNSAIQQQPPNVQNQAWMAALLPSVEQPSSYTRLEKYLIDAVAALCEIHSIPKGPETLVIVSSTKGNIGLMNDPQFKDLYSPERAYLPALCKIIQRHFGFSNPLLALSNACISGSLAFALGQFYLLKENYQHVLLVGGDEVSWFIQSGFTSFQAISSSPCRPFDASRDGISLGEAIVGVYLQAETPDQGLYLTGTGSANDANHISGPSRTGEGLFRSIQQACEQAGHPTIDYISAHGTATRYNDDMESIAVQRAGLDTIPVNSYKGVFGHTLGASGLLETVIGLHCLQEGCLLPSIGFDVSGTTVPLAVIRSYESRPIHSFLKLASGFGGCNQALIFEKRDT
jgi:3-oxoacyl-[acyl-carrier-protein] synthase-1